MKTATLILCLLIGTAIAQDGPPKLAKDIRWGEADRGLRLNVELHGRDVYHYHPGEPVRILILIRNELQRQLMVPRGEWGACCLEVTTPEEKTYIYDPFSVRVDRAPAPPRHEEPLTGGASRVVASTDLRLTTLSERSWIDPRTDKPAVMNFRRPGTYYLTAIFRIAREGGGADCWSGDLRSNTIEFQVSELPAEKRTKEITAEQRRLCDGLTQPRERYEATRELKEMLKRTENEALALHLLELARKNDPHRQTYLTLLSHRAGDAGNIGVDGPYLKGFAEETLKEVETAEDMR